MLFQLPIHLTLHFARQIHQTGCSAQHSLDVLKARHYSAKYIVLFQYYINFLLAY